MAVLFDVGIPAISKHLTNVFETGELSEEATISKMETVQHEGNRDVKRMVVMYKLDAIIAVSSLSLLQPMSFTWSWNDGNGQFFLPK